MRDQNNGNNQLNSERESHNERVEKLANLGKTKRVKWREKRRYRTI